MSLFGFPMPGLDTLLSLPLLSFLVLPSAFSSFSWTSSLNLLFFTLTWATIVWSHDPLNVELFGTLATRVIFYVLPCLVFLLSDILLPSVAKSIKVHGHKALPQQAVGAKKPSRLLSYLGVCLLNILLGTGLQTLVDFIFVHLLHMRSTLRIATALPMPLALASGLARAYLVRGPLAYYIHKHLLHSPQNSATLTRWHKQWSHSLKTTLPFSASYDHPVVYLLHRWLPVYLPAALFRMHMLTYLMFVALISLEEAFAWSGYSVLPSKVMLAGMARRTEAHLMSGGKGNYGPFGVMDWVHGSSLGGTDVMDDVQEEVEKRDVKGKAKDAKNRASDAAVEMLEDSDHDDDEDDQGDGDGGQQQGRNANGPVAAVQNKVSRALRSRK